jgi:hypothetical protein
VALGCNRYLANRPEYEEAVDPVMTCGAACNDCWPLPSNFAETSIYIIQIFSFVCVVMVLSNEGDQMKRSCAPSQVDLDL